MKNVEKLELQNLTMDEMTKIEGGTMLEDFIVHCKQVYDGICRIIDSY